MAEDEAWSPAVAVSSAEWRSTAPDRDDQQPATSGGNGRDETCLSIASKPALGAADTGSADVRLQTITQAQAFACEVNTPEAWRAVAASAGALSEIAQKMAQKLAVVVEAKQTAEELAQTAEEANRTAQAHARAAAEAKQTAEELAQAAEEANRAAADAKQTAEELAQTAEQANRTAQAQGQAAAEAGERLLQLEMTATQASKANDVAAWSEVGRAVVERRAERVTAGGLSKQTPGLRAEGPAATQPSVETPRRRLLPREPHYKLAKYRIEGDVQHRWRPCRLTDISVAGAGLELLETIPAVSEGKTIILMIEDKADVRLVNGVIRQVTETDGTLKIGLQFLELTETTRKHIESLRLLNIRW